MKSAYPGADIDITKREAAATSLTTIVAHVEGDRTNLPPNTKVHDDLRTFALDFLAAHHD